MSEINSCPLVSIILPSYNHGKYVQESIDSIIKQDYQNIELIIIDDGSTDDSVDKISEMINKCVERFVRFEFRHRINKGLPATLNEALAWASGDYFAQIGSDDILYANKTSQLIQSINDEIDVAGVFAECEIIDSDGAHIRFSTGQLKYYIFDDVIRHKHSIHASTQLLRRKCLLAVGGYDEEIYLEDWYIWLKLTEAGYKLKSIPDVLIKYRIHSSNMSNNELKMFDARFKVLSKFSGNSLYKIAYANICVWGAIRFASISKIKSGRFLFDAFQSNFKITLTPFFYKGLLYFALPNYIIRRIL